MFRFLFCLKSYSVPEPPFPFVSGMKKLYRNRKFNKSARVLFRSDLKRFNSLRRFEMEEGLNGRDEVHTETEPLLHQVQRPQFRYLNFRVGREPLRVSKSTKFVRLVLKFCFCSLGLWGHQAWNYILRVLFSAICVYQAFFETHLIVGCPLFDCDFNTTEQTHKDDLQTGKTFYLLLSVAAIISYLSFIGCLVAAKRKDSALASPSQSMMDIDSVDVYLLFVAFLFSQ